MEKRHVIMLLIALLIVAIPFFLYNGKGEGYFSGSDDKGSLAIEETGYHPWFSSIWEPSSEMEILLFALQAAIGALIIGYFLGYYTGKRKIQGK
ncbi:energy-coupling factor ABC transporter substrate-binding protein [Methanobacterium spitsbergense]|uniref:Cobalt transport protein CbiN n=1 Tax=Methanobacterium spitsbergense TaxID=2874285 RepID=A0A8T5V278_9EURY|nr:energy-coupling factor ABC transporter substrate-binding protein [Methanobacterium spitsbergense]MBZ2165785.1 energy-coupling factor ABC transporter substrate-binding protein [Methanobacterium spitsbergense]